IQAKVATGMYSNASEVIREALRLLKDHDLEKELKTQQLKRELSIGLASLDRGEFSQESLEDIRKNVLNAHSKD
ncbi:MAG: type II toxin-antitoxin system ParD family antitoxin, partial [Bacteroidia bacterium]